MTSATEKLKPCPLCGGNAKVEHGLTGTPRVYCTKCRCNTGGYPTEAEAIKTWNTRTPEQVIAATLGSEREKALEELVQDWQALYEEPDYGDCCRLRKRMQELGIEVIDE